MVAHTFHPNRGEQFQDELKATLVYLVISSQAGLHSESL